MAIRRLLFALPVSTWVGAAPLGDRVGHLPGWYSELPSKIYSGYIGVGSQGPHNMHMHYMFVESEGNPASDPVVLWSNGGPGASSLFGLFTELGPFLLSDLSYDEKFNKTGCCGTTCAIAQQLETVLANQCPQSTTSGIPSFVRNPHSWSKVINCPPPVGFSYCDPAGSRPSGDGTSCGSWNDTGVAVHNHEFVKNWLKAFPEYKSNGKEIVSDPSSAVNLKVATGTCQPSCSTNELAAVSTMCVPMGWRRDSLVASCQ
eukprot:gene10240-270_t